MTTHELRDADEARRYLLQSLWMARSLQPTAESTEAALRWSLEMVAGGAALPPVGLVLDVGQIALASFAPAPPVRPPDGDSALLRQYEDIVLGKLYVDESFRRGADAVAHLPRGLRGRGIAWLVERLLARANWSGVMLSPGVIRGLLEQSTDTTLEQSWRSFAEEGQMARLADDLRSLTTSIRNLGDVLAAEDIFEIEHGTALSGFGQRVALRQVITTAADWEKELLSRPPRRRRKPRRRDVASNLLHDDTYPVGGFASIGNRGTIESLLHSQLAYMERGPRPDLFDAKMLRDELLYFVRDENELLRSRRTFVFLLDESLQAAHVKDAGAPWQRIVATLALLLLVVRRLLEWLGKDALRFEFAFVSQDREQQRGQPERLTAEKELLAVLLREQIHHDVVKLRDVDSDAVDETLRQSCGAGGVDALVVSASETSYPSPGFPVARLLVRGPSPELQLSEEALREEPSPTESRNAWSAALTRLLTDWL